jgi:RimJ/RimL family protein N-acetyltransferase
MMNHKISKSFKRILLRPLRFEDIEPLRNLRNENSNWFTDKRSISIKQQKDWYNNYLKNTKDFMFAVELVKNPGDFIGSCGIYNINSELFCAEFGRLLIDTRNLTERGLGYEATHCMVQIAFDELLLNELTSFMVIENERSFNLCVKIGCSFELTTFNNLQYYQVKLNKNSFIRGD